MTYHNGTIRIWYQGFTDPDAHKIYVDKLQSHLNGVAGDGVTVEFHGIVPPANHLHAIEELRCSLRAMANALKAQEDGPFSGGGYSRNQSHAGNTGYVSGRGQHAL